MSADQNQATAQATEEAVLTGATTEEKDIVKPTAKSKFAGEQQEASSEKSEENLEDVLEEETPKSKFIQADLIKQAWKRDGLDPVFEEFLRTGKIQANPSGGLFVDLKNGHRLNWFPKSNDNPEFIGMMGEKESKAFDADDARAVIAASKSKGWEAVDLHGSDKHKNMMWLEAQRQGVAVRNFVPSPEIAQAWEKERSGLDVAQEKTGASMTQKQKVETPKMG